MKTLFGVILMIFAYSSAHATTNCDLTSGASVATIQASINAAANNTCTVSLPDVPSGNVVFLGAGSYTIGSQISIPCPTSAGLQITGVTPTGLGTTWPLTYTTVLNGTMTNAFAFIGAACSNGTTIRYIEWNGGRPSGGGGNMIFANPGMNNLTVTYNYFHGNQAVTCCEQQTDTFVWLDGSPTTARTTNATVSWNRFGATGDCSNLMNLYGGTVIPGQNTAYQGNVYNITGGLCGPVGIHVNYDNLTISNNQVFYQEQGFKFYAAGGPPYYTPTSAFIDRNDLGGVHRIAIEAQQGNPSGQNFNATNNDVHDFVLPGFGTWFFSFPQGGNSISNCYNNLLIGNVPTANDVNGNAGVYPGLAVEFWGNGVCNNNLTQGNMLAGFEWGFGGTPWSWNNNTFQLTANSSYMVSENEQCCAQPTLSGNVTGNTLSAITSKPPTIAPSSGLQSFPLTVTLNDPGYTTGAVPQGNTGIWYTTDGSTPVPGTGTALYLASGGTFVIPSCSGTCVVQAVGMWGALNQPSSYASGYGFVPSSMVTETYTGGAPTTVNTPTMSPTSESYSSSVLVTISDTTPSSSIFYTTDGSTPTTSSTPYTTSLTVTTTETIKAMASAPSLINSGVDSNTYTLIAPTLVSAYQSTTPVNGINTMTVGGPSLQFQTIGSYSDGSNSPVSATTYSSNNTGVCTVTSPAGLVTSVAAGTCRISATVGSIYSSPWDIRVSNPTSNGGNTVFIIIP